MVKIDPRKYPTISSAVRDIVQYFGQYIGNKSFRLNRVYEQTLGEFRFKYSCKDLDNGLVGVFIARKPGIPGNTLTLRIINEIWDLILEVVSSPGGNKKLASLKKYFKNVQEVK